jgi:H+/Cl- antiporter ClcA
MNGPPTYPKRSRLLGLFLIVAATLSVTAIGGMYLACYATHFVWLAVTKTSVRGVEDIPLWLWIPPTAIAAGLIWLVSYILQRLRLRERLVDDVNRTIS